MADLQFQEPQYGRPPSSSARSWLTALVINVGLAKDEASAQKALIGILIITIIAIVAVWSV